MGTKRTWEPCNCRGGSTYYLVCFHLWASSILYGDANPWDSCSAFRHPKSSWTTSESGERFFSLAPRCIERYFVICYSNHCAKKKRGFPDQYDEGPSVVSGLALYCSHGHSIPQGKFTSWMIVLLDSTKVLRIRGSGLPWFDKITTRLLAAIRTDDPWVGQWSTLIALSRLNQGLLVLV